MLIDMQPKIYFLTSSAIPLQVWHVDEPDWGHFFFFEFGLVEMSKNKLNKYVLKILKKTCFGAFSQPNKLRLKKKVAWVRLIELQVLSTLRPYLQGIFFYPA